MGRLVSSSIFFSVIISLSATALVSFSPLVAAKSQQRLFDHDAPQPQAQSDFSIFDGAVADPNSATASRNSQLEWEAVMAARMPAAARREEEGERRKRESASAPAAAGAGAGGTGNADAWFEKEQYQAEMRFGKTVAQTNFDPARHFSGEDAHTKLVRQDPFQSSSSLEKKLMKDFVFTCDEIASSPVVNPHPHEHSGSSSSSRNSRFDYNACASILHCVVCDSEEDSKRTSDSPKQKNNNRHHPRPLNRSSSVRSSISRLLSETPNPYSMCEDPMRLARSMTRESSARRQDIIRRQVAQQHGTLRQVLSDTIVPAVQSVSDWLSAVHGRCALQPLRLVSAAMLSPTRLLLLQESDEKWQSAAFVVDHSSSLRAGGRHLEVGELRRAGVTFKFGTKIFAVDVETFLLPEMKGVSSAAGPYRHSATLSIIPRSIKKAPLETQPRQREDDLAEQSFRCGNRSLSSSSPAPCCFAHKAVPVFSVLSWNLWHTQESWLQHRSIGIALAIRAHSPHAVLLQEMRLDTTATMFLENSARWHNDVNKKRRSSVCDTGARSEVFDTTTYIRHSISMMEHLHRRVRTQVAYFVDMLPAMVYPQERYYQPPFVPGSPSIPVLPAGMFQWQAEGLGLMHKHLVLGRRKQLLPRNKAADGKELENDQHQRGLLCHALLVAMSRKTPQTKPMTNDNLAVEQCDGKAAAPGSSSSSSCDGRKHVQQNDDEERHLVRIDVCTSHFSLNAEARLQNAKDVTSAVAAFAAEPLSLDDPADVKCSSESTSGAGSTDESNSTSIFFTATATILAGDLNAEPDDAAYRFLTQDPDPDSAASGGAGFVDLHLSPEAGAALPRCHPDTAWRSPGGKCLAPKIPPTDCRCIQGDDGETFDRRHFRGNKRIDFMLLRNWAGLEASDSDALRLRPASFRHIDGDFSVRPPLSDHVGLLGQFELV